MADKALLKLLSQGAPAWNRWRTLYRSSHSMSQPLDLKEADLSGSDFDRMNFTGVDFTKANLSRADLSNVNFSGATLSGANLNNARIGWTVFGAVDLSEVKGLMTIEHAGPSVIGIDTIYHSNGNIPELFLQRAGVPEPFRVQMKGLVAAMAPIQFYSCFISYSSKDQEFAERLFNDLHGKGVRCWYAPQHIQAGRKIHEQIDEAIRTYEKLLVVLSENSMNSEWVKTELAKARNRELRENRRMLFPISLVPFKHLCEWECFDAATGKDTAREIREYFIPDTFTNWKNHDKYRTAFNRLLSDLQATGKGPKRPNQ